MSISIRTNTYVKLLLVVLPVFFMCMTVRAEDKEYNIKELIFEHIEDSYKWHICKWKEKDISIHLPVIVKGHESGWHIFMSYKLEDGQSYEGFYIAPEGEFRHKIVERNGAGEEVRPVDISITKTVVGIVVSVILLLVCIMPLAKWYKKGNIAPPNGFYGAIEFLVLYVQYEIIKPCIGEDYKRFSPFLLTAFFFILINNLIGHIPIFPGGANVTGNIAITFFLSFIVFLMINLNTNLHYWKEIFWPNVPRWLKVPIPLIPIIELWGLIIKPTALMIRLFANIMAGHSMIIGLISLIFISVAMGPAANASLSVVAIAISVFISFVELLVAVIQAYVFTLLSAMFIGVSREKAK